jgi:glycosyltransferase involved in cell wall biosynthesis
MNKIIFFGPVQPNNINIVGGGESGNRKTIELLKGLGYEVNILEKPYLSNGRLLYMKTLFFNFFKIIYLVIFNKFKKIHITGYYINSIYYEFVVVVLSKILGIEILYEIRAGGMIESYQIKSDIYKFFFKKTLIFSDTILCQGDEYVRFIEDKYKLKSYYYPNFILDKFIEINDVDERLRQDKIELVYFGRVNESKNISFIIEICEELYSKKANFHLEIIGAYTKEYFDFLNKKIIKAGLQSYISVLPPMNFDDLKQRLKKKHFFLFPTNEKREGHSNSLTEAMIFGVVPIVSDRGFNKTIVNNEQLVVTHEVSHLYATIVLEIWNKLEWSEISKQMYERVINNYTEKKAIETLKLSYKNK